MCGSLEGPWVPQPTRSCRGNFFLSPSPEFALPDGGRELKEPTPPDSPPLFVSRT